MTVLMFIMMGIFMLIATVRSGTEITSRKRYALCRSETKNMSEAGKRLIRQYRALPKESRPAANMSLIVKALDTKYNVNEVDNHFLRRGYEHSYFSWDCRCYRSCSYHEYLELHKEMDAIVKALAQQQHALALAGVESGLGDAKELMTRLREERELIESITKELA